MSLSKDQELWVAFFGNDLKENRITPNTAGPNAISVVPTQQFLKREPWLEDQRAGVCKAQRGHYAYTDDQCLT